MGEGAVISSDQAAWAAIILTRYLAAQGITDIVALHPDGQISMLGPNCFKDGCALSGVLLPSQVTSDGKMN